MGKIHYVTTAVLCTLVIQQLQQSCFRSLTAFTYAQLSQHVSQVEVWTDCFPFQPWAESAGKTENCLECFPLVNDLSYCRRLNSKLLGNGFITLSRLMCGNNCFSETIADVFPSWHCVLTHTADLSM